MMKILDFLRRCNQQISEILTEFDNRLRKMFDGDAHRAITLLKRLEACDKKKIVDAFILLINDTTMYDKLQSSRGVWKTLKVEEYDEELIIKKLQISGHRVTEVSAELITKVVSNIRRKDFDLVKLKVSDLYFKGKASLSQIYKVARELGYELCSSEIGPLLRIFYADQPERENMFVGMEPIMASDGKNRIYTIERFGKTPLIGDFTISSEFDMFENTDTFVFVLPRE